MTLALRRAAERAQGRIVGQVLLVAVALALRVPNLTTHELYRDDAWPALAARTGLKEAVRLGITVPGFEALLRLWLGVSRSTLWAQLPALAASVVSVLLAYRLARRLGACEVGGVVAGAVIALSPISVLYATRVKQYAFDALNAFVLIAVALCVRDDPSSPRRWAALIVVSVAAVVFSASALPVALAAVTFAVLAAIRRDRAYGRAVLVSALFATFALVWSLVVLGAVPKPLHDTWDSHYIHLSSPWRAVADTWHVLDELAAGIFYRHGPTGPLLLLALAATVLAVHHRDVALLLLGPIGLALVLAALQRVPLGGGRIDEYLYPSVALATGLTADRVVRLLPAAPARLPAVNAAVLAAVVAFAATAGLRHARATPYPAADVHALDTAIRLRRTPGDGIVVSSFSRYAYAFYAPARPQFVFSDGYSTGFTVRSTERDVLILPAEYYEAGYDPDAVVRFATGRPRVWYIVTDSPAFDTPPAIQQYENIPESRLLAAGYRVADRIHAQGAHADLLVAG